MKKTVSVILAVLLIALTLCACSGSENKIDESKLEALTIGVPTGQEPAHTIFQMLYSRIAAKGYRIEYVEFDSSDSACKALAAGEIDISLITTKEEFDAFNSANPDVLLNLGPAYYIPYGIFLCTFEEFEDITDGATIAIPEDSEGMARALLLLEANGLIRLEADAGLTATVESIAENTRGFEIITQTEEELAGHITDYEVDIAVMSAQTCVDAGYALNKTARAIEEKEHLAAKANSVVLLLNAQDIASEKHKAVSPLYFSPLMFEAIDSYPKDLIVPSYKASLNR